MRTCNRTGYCRANRTPMRQAGRGIIMECPICGPEDDLWDMSRGWGKAYKTKEDKEKLEKLGGK